MESLWCYLKIAPINWIGCIIVWFRVINRKSFKIGPPSGRDITIVETKHETERWFQVHAFKMIMIRWNINKSAECAKMSWNHWKHEFESMPKRCLASNRDFRMWFHLSIFIEYWKWEFEVQVVDMRQFTYTESMHSKLWCPLSSTVYPVVYTVD